MKKETKMKSLAQKRLRLENLEERQLLTAAGLIDVPYGPDPAPVVCEAPVVEESPAINLAGEALGETYDDLTVDPGAEDGAEHSLRWVIENADAGQTITFKKAGTITLTQGELNIDKSIMIDALNLYDSATGTPGITIKAAENSRVMSINAGTSDKPVVLKGVTITGGNLTVTSGSQVEGGGIRIANSKALSTEYVTISGNSVIYDGNGSSYGGGVYVGSSATFTATNTTISNNLAKENVNYLYSGEGGGVYVDSSATFTATNTLISNNEAVGGNYAYGGGVCISSSTFSFEATPSTCTLTNTTISGNKVSGGSHVDTDGAGVLCLSENTFNSYNSIIAGNTGASELQLLYVTVNASNSLSTYNFGADKGNIQITSAQLAELFNDAEKYDYSLKAGSPAIDKGDNKYAAGTDITGASRIAFETVDIGAYEYHYKLTGVSISGTAEVGQTLTATVTSSEAKPTADYQWYRGETAIEGATDATYDVTDDDSGCSLTVKAIGSGNFSGTFSAKVDVPDVIKEITIDPTAEKFAEALGKISEDGTIYFTEGSTGTISVTSVITLGKSVNIVGTGASVTFDGGEKSQIFTVASGKTVTLTGLTFTKGKAGSETSKVSGGAINNNGTLTVNNSTFTGNVATLNGGAIANSKGATLTVNNSTFTGNKATSNGGAIFNGTDATLTVDGGTISGNIAGLNGGAVASYSTATISGNKLTIQDNEAYRYGGGYYGKGTAELTITADVEFIGNRFTSDGSTVDKSSQGGAIYNGVDTKDGAVVSVGKVTIKGSAIFTDNEAVDRGGAIASFGTLTISPDSDNSKTVEFYGNSANNGGALCVGTGSTATLNGTVTFGAVEEEGEQDRGNSATEFGGAIYSSGALTFTSGGTYTFDGNSSAYFGGAIANSGTSKLTLPNVTLTNNTALKNGGAVFNDANATLSVLGGTVSKNEALWSGGAFTNYGTMTIANYVDVTTKEETATKIEGNEAGLYGGAYFGCGALLINGDAQFVGNEAVGVNSCGGAIYNTVREETEYTFVGKVDITGSVVFRNNKATVRGGAIVSYSILNIKPGTGKDVKFEGNGAWQDDSGEYVGCKFGGALAVDDGCVATIGGSVEFGSTEAGNVATDRGGALYVKVTGKVTFEDGGDYTFAGNSAYFGGAIANVSDSSWTLPNATLTQNTATKNGGAIFCDAATELTVLGGTLSNNYAVNGGAIANYGTMTIANYVDETTKEETATKIEKNEAEVYGGAYFGCGILKVTGDASFIENKVYDDKSCGGAVYNSVRESNGRAYKGNIEITGAATFTGNEAVVRGGAIVSYATLTITPESGKTVTFSNNNGGKYGGAIDAGEGCVATLGGTLDFDSNTAKYGGALYSAGDLTFQTVSEGGAYTFTGNSATATGGAINASDGELVLAGAFTFTENAAQGNYETDQTGLGGGIVIATTATVAEADEVSFEWSENTAARGNCAAVDVELGLTPGVFGLAYGTGDYMPFSAISVNVPNPAKPMLPSLFAANAVAATITIDGVSKTFGEEGVTPEELGLSYGKYDAQVQYTNADGETSETYSLILTVDSDASLEVSETSIANARGVKFDFSLTSADDAAVSVWEISWGDGTTTRSENLSKSWMAAHYYAQDGVFDVSLKVTYLDGSSETFDAFATQTIKSAPLATTAQADVLDVVFADSDDLFDELDNLIPYGPAFSR